MIRLLLVDDQQLVRDGIEAMLSIEPDLEVVGTADNGEVAIQQVEALEPDVVLMDVRMPVMNGSEATHIITQRFPNVKVLVVSTYDDDEYIAQSIKAGAKGYLLKDMPSKELAEAIRLVNRGYAQLAPGLLERLISQKATDTNIKPSSSAPKELADLTSREIEILQLIGKGASNRDIATELFISESTVKSHITNIFNRLNLKNRSQVAIYANSILG